MLSDADDGLYNFLLELQKAGTIKHIGFSTHGSAANIMRMINSNKFAYVNLHKHFFGDYHAAGTPDTLGGQGNAACVKRALELDMGVFGISPFDKVCYCCLLLFFVFVPLVVYLPCRHPHYHLPCCCCHGR